MTLDKVNSTQDLNDSFFIIKALNGNILAVEAITKFNDIDSAEHRAASIQSVGPPSPVSQFGLSLPAGETAE